MYNKLVLAASTMKLHFNCSAVLLNTLQQWQDMTDILIYT